jgi:hypothetical protein
MDNIFKLHGMPDTITSYRDPIFVSRFWSEFFKLKGVVLNKSTTYHPQSDGKTEVVNKCLETYLRCMCSSQPTRCSSQHQLAYCHPHHTI